MNKKLKQQERVFTRLKVTLINKPYYMIYPVAFFLIASLFIPDKVIEPAISKLSADTTYEMYIWKKGKVKTLEIGTLGDFYNCLKGYKKIAHKRPNTSMGYDPISVYFKLGNTYELHTSVNSNEVYFFQLAKLVKSNKEFSNAYAVNCNLNLLKSNEHKLK